jgi:hypothetical protein
MLDVLSPDDPDARRSRLDLRRVHQAMGTRAILRRGLMSLAAGHSATLPLRVLELGAGDGSLMLGVAQALALEPVWSRVNLTLLDRQALIDPATIARYAEVGWAVEEQVGDVLDWAAGDTDRPGAAVAAPWDLIVSNLFLHHFEGTQLDLILEAIAARSRCFFACEPRRDWLALAGSRMIGVIGANHVTRQDSVLSVQAGFKGGELSALWATHEGPWQVREYSAGLFSHCFRAERVGLI